MRRTRRRFARRVRGPTMRFVRAKSAKQQGRLQHARSPATFLLAPMARIKPGQG
jgi:hypothetical protein